LDVGQLTAATADRTATYKLHASSIPKKYIDISIDYEKTMEPRTGLHN
jgi:hypothetical protein